jgi:hypothetical protein
MPFMIQPDRSDVPRSAARPLRYIDRYLTVSQGEVFFMTETLALLEGIERGPAGNTALASAFSLAKEMDQDQIIVVQESEYTGAGKHHQAQLSFAREHGIDIHFGDPKDEVPGKSIILPSDPSLIHANEVDLRAIRLSYLNANVKKEMILNKIDLAYLSEEMNVSVEVVKELLAEKELRWEE